MAVVDRAAIAELGAPEKLGEIVETTTSVEDESAELVAFAGLPRFHQKLDFLSETTKTNLTVTFGVAGSEDPAAPALLFAGGMYGGRWNAPWVDFLCGKKGIRGIFIDRPGLGGSTPVEVSQRVQVWLETVPRVLAHLGVEQVGLVAHSCGIIYALNTLSSLPQVVSSDMPVYMLNPWVHPSKSGVKMLAFASAMPTSVMKGLNKVTSFLVKNLMSDKPEKAKKAAKAEKLTAKDEKVLETCGYTAAETERRRNYFIKRFFDENTTGAGEEFNMGIKDAAGNWGACEDYQTFATQLADQTRMAGKRLRIRAVFGTKDGFIGKGGMKYFNEVWSDPSTADVIAYETEAVDGLDHDGPVLPENGVLEKLFDVAATSKS